MTSRYVVGDAVTVSHDFGADPTTVSLAVNKPDGTSTTYTYAAAQITKVSTGVYSKAITADETGTWTYVWTATGTGADVVDGSFDISTAGDQTLYCSLEELQNRFGIGDTNDDVGLARAARAASRRIDSFCNRERFWRDTSVQTRVFDSPDSFTVAVPVGISTATGLVVKTDLDGDGAYETTLTVNTDFLLKPHNAASRNPAWPYDMIAILGNTSAYFPQLYGRPGVQITARFGWPEVPDDVAEACLILAHRIFKRKETATGVVGFDAAGVTVRLPRTDPDVAELLSPYVRYGIG